jgi:hypothetical protein
VDSIRVALSGVNSKAVSQLFDISAFWWRRLAGDPFVEGQLIDYN